MEHERFDQLARALGGGRSRRDLLKTLTGGALASVAGALGVGRASAAHRLRSTGNSCTVNSDCASNLCVQENRTRKISHCASPTDCPVSTDQCRPAACLPNGYCGTPITLDAPCVDGDNCTINDACQADGTCAGTAVVCPTPTICQISVACDPSTGNCVAVNKADGTLCGADNACAHDICQAGACATNVPKTVGTPCDDGNACTQSDACDGAGACVGGNPVVCVASDQCHDAGVCDTASGVCTNPAKADNTACNDGNACTQTDTCQSGVCTGGNPVTCGAGQECDNGGCFTINNSRDPNGCGTCTGLTNITGSVDGSGNYLCAHLANTPCFSNADCPFGQACSHGIPPFSQCIVPC